MSRHILHEHALGYALFDLLAHDNAHTTTTTHETMSDPAKFGKTCKMVAFAPFKNAKEALENCQEVSEGKRTNNGSRERGRRVGGRRIGGWGCKGKRKEGGEEKGNH